MLLGFYGIDAEEKKLRKLFKTTPLHGTYWKLVEEGMNQLNARFIYLKDQTFQTLEELVKNDTPPVVSVHSSVMGVEDETNHVVVAVGIKENSVIVHDPEMGENIGINKDNFIEAWSIRDRRIGYIVRK